MIDNKDLPKLSDDTIRRFLLGRLPTAEQFAFEQELFTNSGLEARVRLAEIELADDYARQRLPPDEQDQFRERFLVSADREQIYAVSQTLRNRYAPEKTRFAKVGRFNLPDLRAPVWRYAFAALLLILILGTVWRVTRQPSIRQIVSDRNPFKPRPVPTQAPTTLHHGTNESAPEHREPVVPLPPHERAPAAVALDSHNSSNNPAVVKITDPAAAIHFQVSLAGPPAGGYRADFFTLAYQPVFSVDRLEATAGSRLELNVPPGVLNPGDYKVKVMQLKKDANEETYYFRVE